MHKNAVWSMLGPEWKIADVSTFMWIKYKYNEEEDRRERWWIFLSFFLKTPLINDNGWLFWGLGYGRFESILREKMREKFFFKLSSVLHGKMWFEFVLFTPDCSSLSPFFSVFLLQNFWSLYKKKVLLYSSIESGVPWPFSYPNHVPLELR